MSSPVFFSRSPQIHRRHCKPLHQSQSQNCATFPSHIWSFCETFVTPITVLGAEQFAFPCNVFFCQTSAEEVLSMSRNQNGLCWGIITAKASETFHTFWILNMFTCSYLIPWYIWPTRSWGLNLNMWTCWGSKMFEKSLILLLLLCLNKDRFGFFSCSELLQLKFG